MRLLGNAAIQIVMHVPLLTTLSQVELIRRDYTANGGWETFLSYEDPEQGEIITLSAPNYVILLEV